MSRDGERGRLIGPGDRPTRAVVMIAREDLPDCWARGWRSEECKRVALEALSRGEVFAPIAGWPTMTGN